MAKISSFLRGAALVSAFAGISVSAPAQAPSLAMLDQLQKGRWELRVAGAKAPLRSVCLGDPRRQLVQLYHPARSCSQFIIEDKGSQIAVSYSCGAAGQGQTVIRRETNRLVQVDTQGTINGQLFDNILEARHVGRC